MGYPVINPRQFTYPNFYRGKSEFNGPREAWSAGPLEEVDERGSTNVCQHTAQAQFEPLYLRCAYLDSSAQAEDAVICLLRGQALQG